MVIARDAGKLQRAVASQLEPLVSASPARTTNITPVPIDLGDLSTLERDMDRLLRPASSGGFLPLEPEAYTDVLLIQNAGQVCGHARAKHAHAAWRMCVMCTWGWDAWQTAAMQGPCAYQHL